MQTHSKYDTDGVEQFLVPVEIDKTPLKCGGTADTQNSTIRYRIMHIKKSRPTFTHLLDFQFTNQITNSYNLINRGTINPTKIENGQKTNTEGKYRHIYQWGKRKVTAQRRRGRDKS